MISRLLRNRVKRNCHTHQGSVSYSTARGQDNSWADGDRDVNQPESPIWNRLASFLRETAGHGEFESYKMRCAKTRSRALASFQ